MQYPIDEQKQYPLIKKCLEKIFASRVKPLSEKIIALWIEEILNRRFFDSAILNATKCFIEDDTFSLSLPVYLNLIRENMTYQKRARTDCPFCEGRGTAGSTLAFEMDGKIIDGASYLLNCYCNKSKGNLRMNYDEQSFHKTYGKDKYFRVFKDICEKDKYLQKVRANGDMDIND